MATKMKRLLHSVQCPFPPYTWLWGAMPAPQCCPGQGAKLPVQGWAGGAGRPCLGGIWLRESVKSHEFCRLTPTSPTSTSVPVLVSVRTPAQFHPHPAPRSKLCRPLVTLNPLHWTLVSSCVLMRSGPSPHEVC